MGRNDHDYEEEAPQEAFVRDRDPVEVDDGWLLTAEDEDQVRAMRAWFLARYEDPAFETPYSGRDGGYLYLHGGPFEPGDVLNHRFSSIASRESIDDLVDDLISEVGNEWAPASRLQVQEFDPDFSMWVSGSPDALSKLATRIAQLRQIQTLAGSPDAKKLNEMLVYASVVGALESFLWETVEAAVVNNEADLRAVVKSVQTFREEKISLSDIFERHEGILAHVLGYLQNLVWHRWDRVVPLLRALGISPPSFRQLEDAVRKRHDIVHRSGHTTEGHPVSLADGEVDELVERVERIAESIHKQLADRE